MTTDYKRQQLHVGINQESGKALWHTDTEGYYFCGHWYHRTPKQLLEECRSTIVDLILKHPELTAEETKDARKDSL